MNDNILYKIFIYKTKRKSHMIHKWVMVIYMMLTECK